MNNKDWTINNWYATPQKMFDVEDKVTVVTGAASGLGRAIALGFGALGAKLVLADLNTDGAEETAAEIDVEKIVVKCDVSRLEDVQNLLKQTLDHYKRVDVSFNIPGINVRKPALELTYDEWDSVIEINLKGVFRCAKEIGKVMVDQKKGSMINMASVFSEIVMPRQVAYASTKGAIRQMTRVLAAEWAPHVRVNAIGPCYMETPLVKQVMENKEWYEKVKRQNMLQRFGKPEEVVGPSIFLASEASRLITGFMLLVDAGWHCYGGEV